MSAIGRKQTLAYVHLLEIYKETQPDISRPDAHASSMDDDHQAYEFSYALYLARQVDREAAQMIVAAAEVGVIAS